MPRRRVPGYYTRTLVVKPGNNEERDLYLELGLPLLEQISVKIDSSLNRIELELMGEYDDVDRAIDKLRHLEDMIYNALHLGRDGLYQYHANLLNRKFTPPVNLELYSSTLSVFGYNAQVKTNHLLSDASFADIKRVHDKIIDLRHQIGYDLNRDIERFVFTLAIELNTTDLNLIVDRAIEKNIVQDSQYGLQFNMAPDEARTVLLDELGVEIQEAIEVDEEEIANLTMEDFLFDGGRVVFMKDGEEVDRTKLDFSDDDT